MSDNKEMGKNKATESKLAIDKQKLLAVLKSKKTFPVIVVLGVLIFIVIIKSRPNLVHIGSQRPSVPVSYVEIHEQQLKPQIIGYGTVRPDLILKAKAEVTGKVTFINPNLKKGEIFEKDTLLLKIDDKDYLLQLKQSEANLLVNQANLKEMQLNIENNELELILAREKQKVRKKEYARLKKLRKSGAVSQSNLDTERQNLLQQKQEVQQLKNKKTTLPSTLEVMKAQLEISKAKLEKSQRDLERTEVKIPFNGRINKVYTELHQYMQSGAALFDASGLDKMTINAQFPVDQFRLFSMGFDNIDFETTSEVPNISKVLESLGLTAIAEEAGGDFKSWNAKVERFSDDLDPKSRTVGVIVSVSGSYMNVEPSKRPPLLEGMYMKVTLKGKSIRTLVIPRFVLHENQVYVITSTDELKRVRLSDFQNQGELILINASSELKASDRLITSDIFPAVNGMQLTPIIDQNAIDQMNAWLRAAQ